MNKREFSAKTSWDLYEEHKATKGAKSIGRNQHVSTTVSKKFAQNKGQLPDLEMGRKQKQTKKALIQSLQKTENVVFMQGRNKSTKMRRNPVTNAVFWKFFAEN